MKLSPTTKRNLVLHECKNLVLHECKNLVPHESKNLVPHESKNLVLHEYKNLVPHEYKRNTTGLIIKQESMQTNQDSSNPEKKKRCIAALQNHKHRMDNLLGKFAPLETII